MDWHDYAIAIGQVALLIAPLMMFIRRTKVPLASSVVCAITLWVFSVTFMDLGLHLSAVTSFAGVVCWGLLIPRGLVKSSNYFQTVAVGGIEAPLKGSILYNRTKDFFCLVASQTPFSAVIVGPRTSADWSTDDEIILFGIAGEEAMKLYTPQPSGKRRLRG